MAKPRVQFRHNRGDATAKQWETVPWLIKRYKLVILGAASAGKSSMVFHYTQGSYLDVKENTLVASFYSIFLNKFMKFDTWEVAGADRWHSLAPMYYKDAQAALIVYDVRDDESLVCAKEWVQEVRQKLSPDLVIAIAANKFDLWDDLCIDSSNMKSYAKKHGCLYMETSAKTGQNINNIFEAIAEQLKTRPIQSEQTTLKSNGSCCSIL